MEDPLMASKIFSLWLKSIFVQKIHVVHKQKIDVRRAVLVTSVRDTPPFASPLVRIAEIKKTYLNKMIL